MTAMTPPPEYVALSIISGEVVSILTINLAVTVYETIGFDANKDTLTYSLSGSDANYFDIDNNNGGITIKYTYD